MGSMLFPHLAIFCNPLPRHLACSTFCCFLYRSVPSPLPQGSVCGLVARRLQPVYAHGWVFGGRGPNLYVDGVHRHPLPHLPPKCHQRGHARCTYASYMTRPSPPSNCWNARPAWHSLPVPKSFGLPRGTTCKLKVTIVSPRPPHAGSPGHSKLKRASGMYCAPLLHLNR